MLLRDKCTCGVTNDETKRDVSNTGEPVATEDTVLSPFQQVMQLQLSDETKMKLEELKRELDGAKQNPDQQTNIFTSASNQLKEAYV